MRASWRRCNEHARRHRHSRSASANQLGLTLASLAIVAGCVGVAPASPDQTRSAPPVTTAAPSKSSTTTTSVPADIRDRDWAFNGPGRAIIGGPDLDHLRVIAPNGELLIVVIDGMALTTTNTNGKGPNIVRQRDLSTGEVGWSVETPMTFYYAAIYDGRVLLAGESQTFRDSGVSSLDPASGELTEVFPPQDIPDGGSGVTSRAVFVSPTGRTAVTQVCAQNDVCETEIFDPTSGTRTSVGQLPIRVRYVSDEVAIGAPDIRDRLVAYSLQTGKRIWRIGDVEVQAGYLTSEGRLVQSYIDHADGFRYKVALIDPAIGSQTVMFDAEVTVDRQIWATISSDQHAVIGLGLVAEVVGDSDSRVGILDLATGDLVADAFRVVVQP